MTGKETSRAGGRLTLHIGIQRTGTTGLQRALAANRERLAALGLCYPFEKTNHQNIAWRIRRGAMTGARLAKKLAPYAGLPHIVLSAEDFCVHTDLDWLPAIQQSRDVEAIVYLRRQDHWLMSWYNQHVKWPFSRRHSTMTPREFLGSIEEFHWLDFDRLLDRWDAALGPGRLTVRIVETGQVSDTVSDFLHHVGIEARSLDIADAQQNDSLPPEMLEFARRAGMYDLSGAARATVIRLLQEAGRTAGCAARTLYTAAERQGVLARYAATNSAVARHWFGRDELFREGPPDDLGLHIEGTLGYAGDIDATIRDALRSLPHQGRARRDGGEMDPTEPEPDLTQLQDRRDP